MNNTYRISAAVKLADMGLQLLALPFNVWLIMANAGSGNLLVCYFLAGTQLLSCGGWLLAALFNHQLRRPSVFDGIFLATGALIGLCATDERALFLISLLMVIAGPLLGGYYFVRSVSDYAHYRQLMHSSGI
ncbi:MAG TPA: hypothetical protein VL098_00270 [Flavipsychrobacter sp.]|nr:hypothetical protein [Flavipsychrobacter sp.]